MSKQQNYICPRCEYPLVPVHAVEGSKRRVIAIACPEPYCDHMQMVSRSQSRKFKEDRSVRAQRVSQ